MPSCRWAASSFRFSKIPRRNQSQNGTTAPAAVPLEPILGYRVFGCVSGGCCCCESQAYGSRNSSVFSSRFDRDTEALGRSKTSATLLFVTMILSTSPDSNNTVANSCQLISVPWFSRLESQTTPRPIAASAETILGTPSGGMPPPPSPPPPPELLFFVDEALAPPLVFLPEAPPFVVVLPLG